MTWTPTDQSSRLFCGELASTTTYTTWIWYSISHGNYVDTLVLPIQTDRRSRRSENNDTHIRLTQNSVLSTVSNFRLDTLQRKPPYPHATLDKRIKTMSILFPFAGLGYIIYCTFSTSTPAIQACKHFSHPDTHSPRDDTRSRTIC